MLIMLTNQAKQLFGSICYVREDDCIYMGTTEKYWTQITIEENDNPKTFPKKPYRRRFYQEAIEQT